MPTREQNVNKDMHMNTIINMIVVLFFLLDECRIKLEEKFVLDFMKMILTFFTENKSLGKIHKCVCVCVFPGKI